MCKQPIHDLIDGESVGSPEILYPPIDWELIHRCVTHKEPIMIMLARFNSSKGQDLVIRAFSKALSICNS